MAELCRSARFLISLNQHAARFSPLSKQTPGFTTLARQPITGGFKLTHPSPIIQINLEQKRFKKRRASKQDEEDQEEDDEDDELSSENPLLVDDILHQANDGSERLTINISSLRLDTFCKTAFSVTRAKVEESFYKGDIYINGELPRKKSEDISVGDEIDLVKSINPDDSERVNIKRAIILQMPDKASEHGRMKLDIQRWNDLSVEAKSLKRGKMD